MATRVQMPQLGATMTEGRLVKWLVEEGQHVDKGQPIAEIETDKIVTEVTAPAEGVLAKIAARSDDVVAVTGLLGWIAAEGEPIGLPEENERSSGPSPADTSADLSVPQAPPPAAGERPRSSPRARRLARELGVDLQQVRGSGPEGRITGDDVEAYAASTGETRPSETLLQSAERDRVAPEMVDGGQAPTAVTLFAQADASALVLLGAELSEAMDSPLGYQEWFIKIAAHALREYPYMNACFADDGIRILSQINVGFATPTERGMVVPVIRDAGSVGLRRLVREVSVLSQRARDGRLTTDDVTGGTFTITYLGMYGVERFTPPVDVPQCAALGIGQLAPQPMMINGELAVRHVVSLSLTFDHRAVDGGPAARFLQHVVQLVEDPYLLLV
jgi:pyruvate dehydrogenase E2 component (dihydrolipoamide acetyltransferase)